MPAKLVPIDGGPDIPLNRPMVVVGRHPACDTRLDSLRVSRHHCCMTQENSVVVVRDLGSTNGIRINGQRVESGRLRSGERAIDRPSPLPVGRWARPGSRSLHSPSANSILYAPSGAGQPMALDQALGLGARPAAIAYYLGKEANPTSPKAQASEWLAIAGIHCLRSLVCASGLYVTFSLAGLIERNSFRSDNMWASHAPRSVEEGRPGPGRRDQFGDAEKSLKRRAVSGAKPA